jgi:hypothetical protein
MVFILAFKICCHALPNGFTESLFVIGLRWSWENLPKVCSAYDLGYTSLDF